MKFSKHVFPSTVVLLLVCVTSYNCAPSPGNGFPVAETLQQLEMFVQFNDHYKGTIGLTFEQVLKLKHEPNIVDRDIPHLVLLEYMHNKFKEMNTRWGINYTDVVRLTDSVNFVKGEPIPVLEKIDSMYNIFHKKFNKRWNIEFQDVLRFTTKKDITEWKMLHANEGRPTVFDKIDYMFDTFDTSYRSKWKITFEDVISLTQKIDFEVNETIPILLKIDELYFEGFERYWGNGFAGFVRVVLTNGLPAKDVVRRLKEIKNHGKSFKFLPGIFEYTKGEPRGELSVYGVVGVYPKTPSEPLRAIYGNRYMTTDAVAKVVCHSGGYHDGSYDGNKYNMGTAKGLEKYYIVACNGDEISIDDCRRNRIIEPWKDKDDAGFKCSIGSW